MVNQTETEPIDPLAAALVREARLRDAIEWALNWYNGETPAHWQHVLCKRAGLVRDGERFVDDPAL